MLAHRVDVGDLRTIGPLGGVLHSRETISGAAGEDLLCSGRVAKAAKDDIGDRHAHASVGPSGSVGTEHEAVPEFDPQIPRSSRQTGARGGGEVDSWSVLLVLDGGESGD